MGYIKNLLREDWSETSGDRIHVECEMLNVKCLMLNRIRVD